MRLLPCALLLLLAQQPKESHLRAIWGNPKSLDPALAPTVVESRFVAAIFEGLTTFAADQVTVAPGMAESWKVSDDGLTWTFKLRDAKWTNGRAVAAADFRFAWLRCLDPELACPSAAQFAVVKNAEAWRQSRLLDAALLEIEMMGPKGRAAALEAAKAHATKRHAKRLLALPFKEAELKLAGEAAAAAATRDDVAEASVGAAEVDPKTLKVELVRPLPWFPEIVAGAAWSPVPPETIRDHRNQWTDAGKIVTNGPYVLEKHTPNEIGLARSKTYWNRVGGPDRVSLLRTGWPAEAMARYERMDIEWLVGELSYPEKAEQLLKKGEWKSYDLFQTWYLRPNASKPPFDNASMRRWLARGLDREKVAAAAKLSTAKSLVPPGVAGYVTAALPARDLAAAWTELVSSGVELAKLPKLVLLVPKPYAAIAESVKAQIEADFPDLRIRMDAPDWPGYFKSLEAGDYHVAACAYAGEALDPGPFLGLFAKGGVPGWSSDEVDRLVSSSLVERDRKKRLEMLSTAEAYVIEAAAALPLGHPSAVTLARARVKGLDGNPFDRFLLQHLKVE
jgi:oligopeptide transport system substrate-binding protein